jgi:hypothetical protein
MISLHNPPYKMTATIAYEPLNLLVIATVGDTNFYYERVQVLLREQVKNVVLQDREIFIEVGNTIYTVPEAKSVLRRLKEAIEYVEQDLTD